jgi:hypothetical protein
MLGCLLKGSLAPDYVTYVITLMRLINVQMRAVNRNSIPNTVYCTVYIQMLYKLACYKNIKLQPEELSTQLAFTTVHAMGCLLKGSLAPDYITNVITLMRFIKHMDASSKTDTCTVILYLCGTFNNIHKKIVPCSNQTGNALQKHLKSHS